MSERQRQVRENGPGSTHGPGAPGVLSVAARRERDRVEMRQAVLDAARTLFIARGYSNVPVRDIAARIGYSPTTIYRLFDSKDDVFYALAGEGFRLLVNWRSPSPGPPDASPLERLVRYMWTYYEFSCRHPEYFFLMFLDPSAPELDDDHKYEFTHRLSEQFTELFEESRAAGQIAEGVTLDDVKGVMLAPLHGVAAMHVCGAWLPRGETHAAARRAQWAVVAGLSGRELADRAKRDWMPEPEEAPTGAREVRQQASRPGRR